MIQWVKTNLVRNSDVEEFRAIASSFCRGKEIRHHKGIALFELYVSFPDYVVSLLFAIWARAQGFVLNAYTPLRSNSKLENFNFRLFSRFLIDNGCNRPFRIFKSFGVSSFVLPKPNRSHLNTAQNEYHKVRFYEKFEIINYELFGIRVGDLFYDNHLRQRELLTIDTNSEDFQKDFEQFICNFIWWHEYFSRNEVRLVCVSHSVYKQAITARLGVYFGAHVFVTSASRIYRLTQDHLWADTEFLEYDPNSRAQFGYTIDLVRAEKGLANLKQGSKVTAAHYAVSGYTKSLDSRVVNKNSKTKILIAAHCFSDAPHSYGDMLFCDFDEWFSFLHELSLETNFEWYVKAHPAFYDSDKIHFANYLSVFKNFIEVPSKLSNSDLIEQGIDVVLTVYGTIAFEAAELGALVVSASKRAPHSKYNFSLSPGSVAEYREILLNLDLLKKSHKISRNEVLHFFDLHHLRTSRVLFFGEDFESFLLEVGGYTAQFTNPKVLKYLRTRYTHPDLVKSQVAELDSFIKSDTRSLRSFGVSAQ